jgi:hypothetical protein
MLACAVSLALGVDQFAHSTTITVTTGGDAGTAATCTLRQAIAAANTNTAGTSSCVAGTGTDTIQFAGNLVNATITLGGTQLSVTQSLTISGSEQTIDANHLSRVLNVAAPTLNVSNLTLTGGATTGTGQDAYGAGIHANNSAVTLSAVHITNNSAAKGGGGVYGIGGSLTLSGSTVTGNTAVGYGGGVWFAQGTLTISDSVISGNTGEDGGGIEATFSQGPYTASIYRSTIAGNTANCTYYCGGGLSVHFGTANILDSTISGNTANGAGFPYVTGGAYFFGVAATLTNSTITGNAATGDAFVAGALSESHPSSAGPGVGVNLVNCTLASNTATVLVGSVVAGGVLSGGYSGFGALTLSNTILAANSPANSDLITSGANTTVNATFSLLGMALNIGPYNAGANKNVFSDAPGLGPLQANGGPTQTRALLAGSPAIDKGSNALAHQNGTPLAFDQRGPDHPRIFGAAVDIGAMEYSADTIFSGNFEAGP